jgi:hypothetical protein
MADKDISAVNMEVIMDQESLHAVMRHYGML